MAVQCKSLEPSSIVDEGMVDKVGLLDGGATHPLRHGSRKEIEEAEEVPVDLAHGRVVASTTSGDGDHFGGWAY